MEQCGRRKVRNGLKRGSTKHLGLESQLRRGTGKIALELASRGEKRSTSPGGQATLLKRTVMMMVARGPPPVLVNS